MTDDEPPSITPQQRRLIDSAAEIAGDDPESILYQHSVLCQTLSCSLGFHSLSIDRSASIADLASLCRFRRRCIALR
jgi:hypothetical protein